MKDQPSFAVFGLESRIPSPMKRGCGQQKPQMWKPFQYLPRPAKGDRPVEIEQTIDYGGSNGANATRARLKQSSLSQDDQK
jgi:hypothetical protein